MDQQIIVNLINAKVIDYIHLIVVVLQVVLMMELVLHVHFVIDSVVHAHPLTNAQLALLIENYQIVLVQREHLKNKVAWLVQVNKKKINYFFLIKNIIK